MMNVFEIESIIYKYLPEEEGYQKIVIEAMNYSMKAGGKRLRPLIMYETYKLFGGKDDIIYPFMAAMEMIHTYSLVHDDLPAMDNDDYRRGRKTTHKVYGEAIGILAGDGLLNLAFETISGALISAKEKEAPIKALEVLAKKAGIYGMIGGQTVDMEAEKKEHISPQHLFFIHENKTAALLQASLMIGAILAGAPETQVKRLEKCGYNIGIAFQIQDDILDIIGDSKILGKTAGSDEKNNKQTYVTINGIEQAKLDVQNMSEEAIQIVEEIQGETKNLVEIINSLVTREK